MYIWPGSLLSFIILDWVLTKTQTDIFSSQNHGSIIHKMAGMNISGIVKKEKKSWK